MKHRDEQIGLMTSCKRPVGRTLIYPFELVRTHSYLVWVVPGGHDARPCIELTGLTSIRNG
jgi:hypothetical protein